LTYRFARETMNQSIPETRIVPMTPEQRRRTDELISRLTQLRDSL
jgi:hypothetical protein